MIFLSWAVILFRLRFLGEESAEEAIFADLFLVLRKRELFSRCGEERVILEDCSGTKATFCEEDDDNRPLLLLLLLLLALFHGEVEVLSLEVCPSQSLVMVGSGRLFLFLGET